MRTILYRPREKWTQQKKTLRKWLFCFGTAKYFKTEFFFCMQPDSRDNSLPQLMQSRWKPPSTNPSTNIGTAWTRGLHALAQRRQLSKAARQCQAAGTPMVEKPSKQPARFPRNVNKVVNMHNSFPGVLETHLFMLPTVLLLLLVVSSS